MEDQAENKFKIHVLTDRCTGCLLCELACSELFTGIFNPADSRIKVEFSGVNVSICFTDECKECGVCADYCFYGALQKTPCEPELDEKGHKEAAR
jgi:ferredoxin